MKEVERYPHSPPLTRMFVFAVLLEVRVIIHSEGSEVRSLVEVRVIIHCEGSGVRSLVEVYSKGSEVRSLVDNIYSEVLVRR